MSKSKEQCTNIISEKFKNIENNNGEALLFALEESIKEMCDAEVGLLYILDDEDKKIKILNKEINKNTSLVDSVVETVLISKKGFFDNHIVSHKKYREEVDNPLNIKIKSILVTPILDKAKEKVLGFLSASNSIGKSKDFERYEIRSLGLLESYSYKIIELLKAKKEKDFKNKVIIEETRLSVDINIEKKEKNKIEKTLSEETKIDFKNIIKIQSEKIKELEDKLSWKTDNAIGINSKEMVVAEEVLEAESKNERVHELKYILDFLTNEVTYLANEEHKIYLFLEIIKNSLHNKEQLNFIERELSNSHLINNLANELYTRDKMPLLFEEFNGFKIFSSVGHLYYQSFSNENIVFNIFIEPNLPVLMVSDIAKIKSLIVHLMNNVYSFISSGGVVDFSVFSSEESKTLNIEIKAFMPYEVKNLKSFFKKRQISHSIITEDKGLGLSVCSNLINILGGKLKLSREESSEHSFMATIPIKIVPKQKRKEFFSKSPMKIVILMHEDDEYSYQNFKRYLIGFKIPETNILIFKNHKKIGNIKISHLFCFESMLSEKFDMSHFSSVTILKNKEERLIHPALSKIKRNELIVNAYYGMALQQILFPHLPVEEIEDGTIIIEDSFLKKFNNVVNMLKFS
jgi:hypothetical protein